MKTYSITTAVIKYKDKFLIGKRSTTKKFVPNKWEFISGFLDKPISAEEIIIEELKEETKLAGKLIKTAIPYSFTDEEGRWIVIPFLIEVKENKFKINKKDHSELKWVSLEELKSYSDLLIDVKEMSKRGII